MLQDQILDYLFRLLKDTHGRDVKSEFSLFMKQHPVDLSGVYL
jgi:hypothetical protein